MGWLQSRYPGSAGRAARKCQLGFGCDCWPGTISVGRRWSVLLQDKKIVVTGILSRSSIAYSVAEIAMLEGAEVLVTSFGRVRSITERAVRRLPKTPDVLELDVNREEDIVALRDELQRRWGSVDGLLHAVAYAPDDCLGGRFLESPWESVQVAFRTSTFSLKAVAAGLLPLMSHGGGSIVTLDFDNTVAWPIYDWMGVCKAGLESVVRYLARDLGRYSIRVNAVSAGPLATMAAKSIPGFTDLEHIWGQRAPLGWDSRDPVPVAKMVCVLLSDWSTAVTGEMVHVDGGYHAVGAETPGSSAGGPIQELPEVG